MWTLSPRPPSKTLDKPPKTPSAPADKPAAPPGPPAPRSDGKPPQPYPAPADQYWRWVQAQVANADDTEEQFEAAAYIIEVLHSLGVTDVPAYIARVERYMKQDQAFNRRRLRIAAFHGLK